MLTCGSPMPILTCPTAEVAEHSSIHSTISPARIFIPPVRIPGSNAPCDIVTGSRATSIAALAFAVTLAGVLVPGLVFGGLHEVHRPPAGVVPVAVLRPVPGMTRGHMHVDRRHGQRLDLLDDHHRLRIQDGRRRPVADVDATV